MKKVVKLAFSYLRYYKKQTLALLAGMILSAGILTGIGSLFYSGKQAALENAETGSILFGVRNPGLKSFSPILRGKAFRLKLTG